MKSTVNVKVNGQQVAQFTYKLDAYSSIKAAHADFVELLAANWWHTAQEEITPTFTVVTR